MADYGETMALYAAYQAGELQAEGLEAKARILCGWDDGEAVPLTSEERTYMVHDAHRCSPAYPEHEAPTDSDKELSRWWLRAMQDYVDDLFG